MQYQEMTDFTPKIIEFLNASKKEGGLYVFYRTQLPAT